MKPQIRLHARHLSDLQLIGNAGADAIKQVIVEVKKLAARPYRTKDLQAALLQGLKDDSASEALLRQLLSLHALMRNLNISSTEVCDALQLALQQEWAGEEAKLKVWLAISELVKELFDLEVIRLSAKALDLSYEHAQLLQRARILTDIRPVFNEAASEIRGTVISHTLLLRFDDTQGNHVLSLALDEGDIEDLVTECERALTKSKTARDRLEKADVPTLLPTGKDHDE